MEILQNLFTNTWQTGLVFASLLLFARILGKTQVGQLTCYEYISGITIGSIAGNIAACADDEFYWHFYDLTLFVILTYLVAVLSLKNRFLRRIVEGTPTLLISHGAIHKSNMRSVHFDLDQLIAELRLRGIADIREVAFAFLETSGQLSVIKHTSHEPPSRSDLNMTAPPLELPLEIILDGEIITENLTKRRLTLDWLNQQLQTAGIKDKSCVFYAALTKDNTVIWFLDNE